MKQERKGDRVGIFGADAPSLKLTTESLIKQEIKQEVEPVTASLQQKLRPSYYY